MSTGFVGRFQLSTTSQLIGPVSIRGVRAATVEILREAIWRSQIKPGERLNEQVLAEQLGVSRPPLREAIRVLEGEGLVRSSPRRGAFVTTLSREDVFEIYAIRLVLERLAADTIIDKGDPSTIAELEEKLRELQNGSETGLYEMIRRDLEFHRSLVAASNTARLLVLWERLAGELRLALSVVDPSFFSADFVLRTHWPLLDALRERDRDKAEKAIAELLVVDASLRDRWAALGK